MWSTKNGETESPSRKNTKYDKKKNKKQKIRSLLYKLNN